MSRFRPKQRQRDANIFGSGKKLIKTGDEKIEKEAGGRAEADISNGIILVRGNQ